MILVDANLLVYSHLRQSDFHDQSRRWLDDRINQGRGVALPWQSLLAFLRIVTNRHLSESPRPIDDAWRQVQDWLDAPGVWSPEPGERFSRILAHLIVESQATGNLVADAYLASLAMEHGLILCSADQDFARFPGLRWENPLAA